MYFGCVTKISHSILIEQIARRTGTSSTTVRRVLRGGNKEVWSSAAARANRIRSVARELGFLSNASASAMRKGRFDSLMLVLSETPGSSHIPERFLQSLLGTLEETGQRLVLARCSDAELMDSETLPSFLANRVCDGAILNYTHNYPAELERILRTCRIPFLWHNAPLAADCVRYDDRAASFTATQKLLDAGHRRIAYIDLRNNPDEPYHYSADERIAGFRAACHRHLASLPPIFRLGGLSGDDQLKRLVALFQSPDRPTGVLTYDFADRVLYAAAVAGLSVPRDLSVLSFFEEPTKVCTLPLTGMITPSEEAARTAVTLLLRKIAEPHDPVYCPPLAFSFDPGASLAPPTHEN